MDQLSHCFLFFVSLFFHLVSFSLLRSLAVCRCRRRFSRNYSSLTVPPRLLYLHCICSKWFTPSSSSLSSIFFSAVIFFPFLLFHVSCFFPLNTIFFREIHRTRVGIICIKMILIVITTTPVKIGTRILLGLLYLYCICFPSWSSSSPIIFPFFFSFFIIPCFLLVPLEYLLPRNSMNSCGHHLYQNDAHIDRDEDGNKDTARFIARPLHLF